MCGIVYAHSFEGLAVNNAVMEQFDQQRSRGTQGFGLFDGQENHMVHAAKEDRILNWLCKYDSNLILFHHRFPTSTVNVKRAAHPFSTKAHFGKKQYILVHNGHIRNSDELFVAHQEHGIDYQSLLQDMTFNDSEALLWDFALTMEGKQEEMEAYGAIAFVCLKLVDGVLEKMYFGRNRNPLNMLRSEEGIMLSSEGEGEAIKADTLYTWHYKSKRLTSKAMKIKEFKPYIPGAGFHNYQPSNPRSYTPGSYADDVEQRVLEEYDEVEDDQRTFHWSDEEQEAKFSTRMGNILSRQFGHLFQDNRKVKERESVFGYVRQNDGSWIPEAHNIPSAPVQRKTAEQELILRRGVMPDEQEVTETYMEFLASVGGHFEQAYWAIEVAYETATNAPDTIDNIRTRALIEKVMERIDTDPEYINEDAISSIWRIPWQQQQKLLKKNNQE